MKKKSIPVNKVDNPLSGKGSTKGFELAPISLSGVRCEFQFIFLLMIFSISLQAQAEGLPTYLPNSCVHDPEDPFEPNVRVDHGPLKGLCVNPTQRRSVKILTDSEAAPYFSRQPGSWVIANFSHLGRFWVAQIPVEDVERLKVQIEYFPILKFPKVDVAHTQFVFEFDKKTQIQLTPQIRSPGEKPNFIYLKKMIFSVENIGPYGEKFHALRGFNEHYHIAYRAVSLKDKFKWTIAEQKHRVAQRLLKLSPTEVRWVLKEALTRGDHWSTRREYHTLDPNCATELLSILDESLPTFFKGRPSLPNALVSSLYFRGLLDSRPLPDLNDDPTSHQ